MVTLRDIAKETGYSKTTVWLALTKNARIPVETRKKIEAAAKRLGYHPNPAYKNMLRQVRAGRSINYDSTLALIHSFDIPDPEDHDPYHHELVKGMVGRATELGYKVEKFWSKQPRLKDRRLSQILEARGIQGIVITPIFGHFRMELEWEKFAAVTIGYTLIRPKLNRVEANNPQAMALCLMKLLSCGYSRIGLVMRLEHEQSRRYELSSAYLWLQSNLAEEERCEVFVVDPERPDLFYEWFERYGINAIVSTHPCVVDWLKDIGKRVPEDVGIVFPTPVYDYKDFAHVNQDPYRIGMASTDMLVAQLNRNELGCPDNPKTMRTEVSWNDGPSITQVGEPVDDSVLSSVF